MQQLRGETASSGFSARLLAEAVRLHEDGEGGAPPPGDADEAALRTDGDFEHRIVVRAGALPVAEPLEAAFQRLRRMVAAALAISVMIALAAGATTAQVALAPAAGEPVNFFWLLGSLLGVHTLALLLWLAVTLLAFRRGAGGFLGSAVIALTGRIDRLFRAGPVDLAAARAAAAVLANSAIGRWTAGAISHLLWLAFLAGCLSLVLLILSTRQYNFAWETTILSEQSYVALTRAVSAIPQAVGFPTPNSDQVIASRWTGDGSPPMDARRAWAGLLIGSILIYGLLPRILALAVTLVAWRRATARFRLDTSRVGYARLRPRLMPPTRAIGVVDADEGVAADLEALEAAGLAPLSPPPMGTTGPVAIVGLEIERPGTPWPPALPDVEWMDLGFVDSRADRRRALDDVLQAHERPRLIVAVCALPATPDRGLQAFVAKLQHTAKLPVALVLTAGQRLRERRHHPPMEQRLDDWRTMAAGAGVPQTRVLELDLDHMTATSRQRLRRLLAGNGAASADAATSSAPTIAQAFALVIEHAGRWSGQPSTAEQAELQSALARLYAGTSSAAAGGQTWRRLLHLPAPTDIAPESLPRLDQIKAGAGRMVDLLPRRLQANPRWLAAGAAAGALGCVAAAALLTPAAITALPAWAALGAAIPAFVPRGTAKDTEPTQIDLGEAVTAAALFALLLHLQGRDEATITRIIDRVAGDDDPPVISDIDGVRAWLATLRHRLDTALAAEATP